LIKIPFIKLSDHFPQLFEKKSILTLVLSMVGIVLALSLAGNELPWDHPVVVGSLVGGIVLLLLFIFIEGKIASQPIMPLDLLSERTPMACYIVNFFSSMSSLASVFLIPLWFQVLFGQSAAQSGIYLIPKIVSGSIGSIVAGNLMARTGNYLGLTWFSCFAMMFSEALILGRWRRSTPEVEVSIFCPHPFFFFFFFFVSTLTFFCF
jgi:hypothetical protein